MNQSETALRQPPTDREVNPASAQSHQESPNSAQGIGGSEPVTTSGDCAVDLTPAREETRLTKVLVATDFSSSSAKAVEHASVLANQSHANLTILHVIDINAQAARGQSGVAAELMKALWEEGLAKMRQMAWSLNGTVNAQTAMQEGLPWEEIAIKSQEADLLVIGKSCEKAGGRLFSRRTAQRVIANAACPVLVV